MRQDIQFLRGLAVTAVVLEHAGLGLAGGFLGVDIFFVISGYLITRMIQTQLEEGRFSFADFYLRRAKRLLPAAFTTFALTAFAAPYFLTTNEMAAFADQLLGAVTFSANIVLWNQTGYFDTDAALKPLLHIWSLSLEEQYYFLLPAILVVVSKRFWIAMALALLAASGALCLYLMYGQPDAAFYLLPSRAWELMIGSTVALMRLDADHPAALFRWAFWPSLAVVVLLPFFPTGYPHPGLDAILICLATAAIIINRRAFFGTSVTTKWMAWIGNPSYSLYLAHWPIISFTHSAYIGEMSVEVKIALVILSTMVGLVLYYAVERPIHRLQNLPRIPSIAAASIVVAGVAAVPSLMLKPAQSAGERDFAEINAPNFGLDKSCSQSRDYQPLAECQTGEHPRLLVWGDSFGMHLMQGLVASAGQIAIRQATRSACPPTLTFAQFNNSTRNNEQWAEHCIRFNRQVFDSLRSDNTIDTVVLASEFRAFERGSPWQAVIYEPTGDTFGVTAISEEQSVTALIETIQAIRSVGKKVVVVAPPPASGIHLGNCLERQATGLLIFGVSNCSITVEADARLYGKVMRLLETLSDRASVEVLDMRSWLCTSSGCATTIGDIPLYRDWIHLSATGSEAIGRQHHMTDTLLRMSK